MKITLISPYSNIANMGLRLVSSTLKRAGYQTQILSLPRIPKIGDSRPDFKLDYTETSIKEVIALCKESDLVGISLMSNYVDIAIKLTQQIKENTRALTIWGGIHPTIKPLECLDYSDMVCIGEGEEACLDLVQRLEKGTNYMATRNIWFKTKGKVIQNAIRPLLNKLDILPFPDYDMKDEFILDNGIVQKIDPVIMKRHLRMASIGEKLKLTCYQTMVTRGCPYRCTYCCNNAVLKIYKGQKMLRIRGHENIINELLYIKKKLPFISGVWFSDDSLMSIPYHELKKMCALYKKMIGLPFFCLTLPVSVSEKKMDILVDAGLTMIKMGLQSGSQKTLALYKRNTSNLSVIKATEILNNYKDKMLKPVYDIILDNAYETDEDVIETLNLLLEIHRPFHLELYSLTFFPGTELYEKAKIDGIIEDDKEDVYKKWYYDKGVNYLNFMFHLININTPKSLLKVLINKRIVRFFRTAMMNKLFGILFYILKDLKHNIKIR